MRCVVGLLPSRTGGGGAAAAAASRQALSSPPLTMPSSPISMLAALNPPRSLRRLSPLGPSRASADSREAPSATRSSSSERRETTRGGGSDSSSSSVGARGNSAPSAAAAAAKKHQRPRLGALVVVEGPSDARAVLRAVDLHPGCHSLDGATWARNKNAMDELVRAAEKAAALGDEDGGAAAAAVVLLLDPDAPGRVARGEISRELCRRFAGSSSSFSLYHAFIPPEKCRATQAVGGKQIGDVGVEHASPETVVAALRWARRHRGEGGGGGNALSSSSSPVSPPLLSMRELEEARLATSFDAGSQQQQKRKAPEKESESEREAAATTVTVSSSSSSSQKTSDRRKRFCDALGLGPCTGAQLLRALNEWGLTREDWEVGLKAAEAEEEDESTGGGGG